MKLNIKLLIGASAVALLSMGGTASAQDCPRGDLDDRFCDVDGDLIADIPTDAADQIDPDTLIFAYTPVEDPAVYATAWSDFLTGHADIIGHGSVRHVPLASLKDGLPPEEPGEIPDTPPLAARISAAARTWIGRERFEKLVHKVKGFLPAQNEMRPDRYMLELFSTRGRCRIDHACRRRKEVVGHRHDLTAQTCRCVP